MLADAIEATSSALRPNSEKAIEKLVSSIVGNHLSEGQLDDSGLTLGDVKTIQDSFVKTIKGRFHMRVKYPGNEELTEENEASEQGKANETVAISETPPLSPLPSQSTLPQSQDVPSS